jgi:hypothetical protein
MKHAIILLAALLFGAAACVPANAAHNGETGGIVPDGVSHHDSHRHRHHHTKSHIVRDGGHEHRHYKRHQGPHWGKHHHHGVHLEGSR